MNRLWRAMDWTFYSFRICGHKINVGLEISLDGRENYEIVRKWKDNPLLLMGRWLCWRESDEAEIVESWKKSILKWSKNSSKF